MGKIPSTPLRLRLGAAVLPPASSQPASQPVAVQKTTQNLEGEMGTTRTAPSPHKRFNDKSNIPAHCKKRNRKYQQMLHRRVTK